MNLKIQAILAFLLITQFGSSQEQFIQESERYWYYRDRLKYFVMPGADPGQSVVITCRNSYKDYGHRYPIFKGIETANTHKLQGYYLGMLATEYKLLKDNGQNVDASATLQELNLALDALLRMDYCEGNVPWNLFSVYNGFFIRDDYPSILSQPMTEYFNKDLVNGSFSDYCTQIEGIPNITPGLPGLPFAIDSNCVFARYKYENPSNYYYQNPLNIDVAAYSTHNATYWDYWKDECFTSNDEIIGDLMGLAMITFLVDDMATKWKANMVAYNYYSCMISNPSLMMLFPDLTPIGFNNGGYSAGFIWGVSKIINRMIPGSTYDQPGSDIISFLAYNSAVTGLALSQSTENSYNRGLYLKLISLGEAAPWAPFSAITRIGDNDNLHTFYLLLWSVINDKDLEKPKYEFPFELLISDFETAPCGGPYNYLHYYGLNQNYSSTGWCNEYKYDSDLASQQDNAAGHNGVYPGLDYMLLYNLACLAFPNGFDYGGQHYYFPPYVNQINRSISAYYPMYYPFGGGMEYGSAANPEEIRVISTIETNMVVSNEALFPLNGHYLPGYNGDVRLKAGESIKLTDGFRVDAGAHFLARIESYSCGGVSYRSTYAPPWDENYRGCFYDTLISVPMDKRSPIVYSEDNYEEDDFDRPLWNDYYYTYDTTAATELAVGAWINPNPCGSSATLTVVSETEQQLTIDLYDMTGIKRETVFADLADLNLILNLNLSSYASGTYMLCITGSGGVKVLRFVKE